MTVRARALLEAVRSSFFFTPARFVVLAVLLAQVSLAVDRRIDQEALPALLRTTVDGSRALLGTLAGATVTVAALVFSITAIAVQLASSQYSSRVLRGYLRDRFQQRIMGLLVGAFTFHVLVLQAVRSTGDDDQLELLVPNVSAAVAVVLGVAVVLAILASVDHTARFMQAGNLIRRVTDETLATIRAVHPERDDGTTLPVEPPPDGAGGTVAAVGEGWVQQIDDDRLLRLLPRGVVARLEVRAGSFVVPGQPIVTVWPASAELHERHLRATIAVGRQRTMQQDVDFGIRQLVDIAERALSPSVNDATTASEVLVHLTAVLGELLARDLPPRVVHGEDDRRLLRPHELDHVDFVERACNEIRINAVRQPDVVIAFLEALTAVARQLQRIGMTDRALPLRVQAGEAVKGVAATEPLEYDLDRVRRAARELEALGSGSPTRSASSGP